MDIKQISLSRMATFAYLVGDPKSSRCALIDPAFDTDKILGVVRAGGYAVSYVINTHGHSDHTAGNSAVLSATGAKLLIHELDSKRLGGPVGKVFSRMLGGRGSPAADTLLKDRDRIDIGAVSLQVIHTPGHTAGSICLYGDGHVFTGDTLFVGAVGRTDLPGGSAKRLFQSITERLYALPDDTTVWPGHDYGPSPKSTIGREKRTNPFARGVA